MLILKLKTGDAFDVTLPDGQRLTVAVSETGRGHARVVITGPHTFNIRRHNAATPDHTTGIPQTEAGVRLGGDPLASASPRG